MPDPTTTLSTILGLLSIFKSERRATSDDEFKAFLEWLIHKQHKVVVDEININHQLSLSIKILLQKNHEDIMKVLSSVDNSLTMLASKISALKEISHAINPNLKLSEQAISIIEQLIKSERNKFIEIGKGELGGISYMLEGRHGNIQLKEPLFVEDDLKHLVSLDLLIENYNSAGNKEFSITRNAVSFYEQVK